MFHLRPPAWGRLGPWIWWTTLALFLGTHLAAWPVGRTMLTRRAAQDEHSFWVENFSNPRVRGRPDHCQLAGTSSFRLDAATASLRACALWHAPRAGVYQFRMGTEDAARVYVDRQELSWQPATTQGRDCTIALDDGPHVLVTTLEGRGHSGRLDLTVRAPGEGGPQLLQGASLSALPRHGARAWRRVRVIELLSLVGAALVLLGRPLLVGPSYGVLARTVWRRPIQSVAVASFLLILLLPTLQSRYALFPPITLDENRVRLRPPEVTWQRMIQPQGVVGAELEKYFNERYGLRDLFIRAKHQMDFSLFRQSDEVVVGRRGWMCYRNVIDRQEVAQQRSAANLDRLFRDTRALAEHLKQRGMQLLVISNPMKNTVYPEFFRHGTPRRPADTCFQKYRRFLASCPELIHIDAQQIQEDRKAAMPVFHKTDFHWNDPPAYYVARQLVEAIAAQEAISDPVWQHPLKMERREFGDGGLTQSLALLRPPREQALFVTANWSQHSVIDSSPPKPFETIWRATDSKVGRLPCTVVYGNSFVDALERNGYHTYFQALHRIRTSSAGWRQVLDSVPTDCRYFVLQVLECGVPVGTFHEFALK